ncbi:glucose-6-phosphate dehydrogenase [Arthrobacter sp. H20]|uniref:glucose-6-phosphate dehydrogenase n=1 Tax=Arthrobacter sp. H20 TaxID=1267981 RepID=UPI000559D2B2|nr:glucose-6-phosphate dehydrogenase [Arthrobacter sp. H20]
MATLLILGASGDLTGRLLLPGLARLVRHGRATGLHLVGAGYDAWTAEQWSERVAHSFAAALEAADDAGQSALNLLRTTSEYRRVDVTAPGELAQLTTTLPGPTAVYFALPPAIAEQACELLSPGDLPAGTRLVMEKPFGTDQASAFRLNETLTQLVPEDHIHRVDHFLGKATVLNILGLRFANRLLEPVWNNLHIDRVEVVYDEALALESRAGYYDGAGALRDMIQSHLLHAMAILAMESPVSLHERDLRDGVGAVLRASSVDPDFARSTRRARYTAGTIDGKDIPDYAAEDGVDPSRRTETLAEITVSINNARWSGVPFILRSGKALGGSRKEALVTFKPVSHLPTGFSGQDSPTQLRIGFGPETLKLEIDVNGPGDIFALDRAVLEVELNASELLPYGEVLEGVLTGDPTLSVRGDTAEDCWRIVDPVLDAWATNEVALEEYPAGSSGPAAWTDPAS